MTGRPCCAWCGRQGSRVTDSGSGHVFEDETRSEAERRIARGLRVIRSQWTAATLTSSVNGRRVRGFLSLVLEPEGGPRFVLNRSPFCRLACAEEFARAAYVGGFRRAAP